MPVPDDNPLTVEKVELGRRLFHDRRLSRSGHVNCASCHNPRRGFSSPQALAVGVFGRRTERNAPALLNRAWGRAFFWDGRIATLEAQVLAAITNPNEMDLTLTEASARVGVDTETMARALASYVRSILTGDSPYDRFINGDRGALRASSSSGSRCFGTRATAPRVTSDRVSPTSGSTTRAWRGRTAACRTTAASPSPAEKRTGAPLRRPPSVKSRARSPICTMAASPRSRPSWSSIAAAGARTRQSILRFAPAAVLAGAAGAGGILRPLSGRVREGA
jgi:hypothetical protein